MSSASKTPIQDLIDQLVASVPGLLYIRDFVTPEEEQEIVANLDAQEWATDLKRRVQQYGYTFLHESQQVKLNVKTPPMPDWLEPVRQRLMPYFGTLPDQLIVNEYLVGQGIHPHIDKTHCFGDVVATVSLLSSCIVDFYNPETRVKHGILLERRSLLVLTGDARFKWTHGISGSSYDVFGGKEIKRKRRISLTYRTMKQEYLDKQLKSN